MRSADQGLMATNAPQPFASRPLDGKVAIVTGASRGIGHAIARRLAADGARCIVCARDATALARVAAEIERAGGAADVAVADLRDPDSAARIVDLAVQRHARLDILVNNAGATARGAFTALNDDQWSDGFALKFFGAVRLCRTAWRHLEESRGSIVNIAGVGGRTPGAEFAIGGSVNAALMCFTKSLADTGVASGVQVNAINPGSVRTNRLRKRLSDVATRDGLDVESAERRFVTEGGITRIGEPDDIAGLVAFVVGPEGRFLHGALIDMDGGATKAL